MAKGKKTGGRKKGTPNKASVARERAIAESGLTPLDFLLGQMRDVENPVTLRLQCARDAAPYVHPKLATVDLGNKDNQPLQVQVLRFSEALSAIAASK